MGDEIRTMLLIEFGCPPLPIADGKRFESDQPAIINSHDLLSMFLIQMYKRQDDRLNDARKDKQRDITNAYYKNLRAADGAFDKIYAAMSTYTRDYLGTFLLPPFSVQDVRVLPPDFVSPALRREIDDYRKALRIAHECAEEEKCGPQDLYDLIKGCHAVLAKRSAPQTGAA